MVNARLEVSGRPAPLRHQGLIAMDKQTANRIRDRVQARCEVDPKLKQAVGAAWALANDALVKAGANYGQVDAARLAFLIKLDGGHAPVVAYVAAIAPYRKDQPR